RGTRKPDYAHIDPSRKTDGADRRTGSGGLLCDSGSNEGREIFRQTARGLPATGAGGAGTETGGWNSSGQSSRSPEVNGWFSHGSGPAFEDLGCGPSERGDSEGGDERR